MHNDIERIMYTEEDIKKACKRMGKQITDMYNGENLLLVGILKGSFVFMSDLIRCIDTHCKVDFMEASSYYGKSQESSGVVTITKELNLDIAGYHVIIVEDIIDTGNTLYYIKDYFESQGALSIKYCSLFDKPCRRKKPIKADIYGFEVGDEFIVGYGLDFDERYRNLPYVGILKPEIYQN